MSSFSFDERRIVYLLVGESYHHSIVLVLIDHHDDVLVLVEVLEVMT